MAGDKKKFGAIALNTATTVTIGLSVIGFFVGWISSVSDKVEALQVQFNQTQNTLQQQMTKVQTDVSWIKSALEANGFKTPKDFNNE